RTGARSGAVSLPAGQGVEGNPEHLSAFLEPEPLVEPDRIHVSRLDLELHVRQAVGSCGVGYTRQKVGCDPAPARLLADVQVDDDDAALLALGVGKAAGAPVFLP